MLTNGQVIKDAYSRGLGYYQEKKFDRAWLEVNKVLELNPRHEHAIWLKERIIDVMYLRALNYYYNENDVHKALCDVNDVLKLKPDHENAKELKEDIIFEVEKDHSQINLLSLVNRQFRLRNIRLPKGIVETTAAENDQQIADQIFNLSKKHKGQSVYLLVYMKNGWYLCYGNSQFYRDKNNLIKFELAETEKLKQCYTLLQNKTFEDLQNKNLQQHAKVHIEKYIENTYFTLDDGHCSAFAALQGLHWLTNPDADPNSYHPWIEAILHTVRTGKLDDSLFMEIVSFLGFTQSPIKYISNFGQSDIGKSFDFLKSKNSKIKIDQEFRCKLLLGKYNLLNKKTFAKMFNFDDIPDNRLLRMHNDNVCDDYWKDHVGHAIIATKKNNKIYIWAINGEILEYDLNSQQDDLCDYINEMLELNVDGSEITCRFFANGKPVNSYQNDRNNISDYYYNCGVQLYPNNKEAARKYFKLAIGDQPTVASCIKLADFYYEKKMYESAEKYYHKALSIDKDAVMKHKGFWVNLIHSCQEQKKYNSAIQHYNLLKDYARTAKTYPKHMKIIHFNMGVMLCGHAKMQYHAFKCFKQAFELDKQNVTYRRRCIDSALKAEQYDFVKKVCESLEDGREKFSFLCSVYSEKKDFKRAIRCCKKAIEYAKQNGVSPEQEKKMIGMRVFLEKKYKEKSRWGVGFFASLFGGGSTKSKNNPQEQPRFCVKNN